jgi:hypothetical protein
MGYVLNYDGWMTGTWIAGRQEVFPLASLVVSNANVYGHIKWQRRNSWEGYPMMLPGYFLILLLLAAPTDIVRHRSQGEVFDVVDDIDLWSATESYKSLCEELSRAKRQRSKRSVCEVDDLRINCLVNEKWPDVPLPPFTAYVQSFYSNPDMLLVETAWAPTNKIIMGEKVYETWLYYADHNKAFACTDEDICEFMVHTPYGIAHCNIEKLPNGDMGAPQECWPAARIENGVVYLSVAVREMHMAADIGLKDFDLVIRSKVPRQRAYVIQLLVRALRAQPLNLSVAVEPSGDILGVASRRTSKVLKDWREIATIRLKPSFDEQDYIISRRGPRIGYKRISAGSLHIVGVQAISTLYVNRQNTDSHSDWTLPSASQEALWTKALISNLKASVESICQMPKWIDDYTLDCP